MVEDDKVVDLIVEDDFFVHYFTVPQEELEDMKSLSKHIVFLLDVSDSMSGPKLEHAKEARDNASAFFVNPLIKSGSIYLYSRCGS